MKRGVLVIIILLICISVAVVIIWKYGWFKGEAEIESLCHKASLELNKVCWDDNKIFLDIENSGEILVTHLNIMVFGNELQGEAVTEKEIEIGSSKKYSIEYEKEKLGEIDNIGVSPYIRYEGQSSICDIINKNVNDCVTSEPPDEPPDENPLITYIPRGGGGGGGGGGSGGNGGNGNGNGDKAECGNGICETNLGEDCSNCESDCGCNRGYVCDGECKVNQNICQNAEDNELCEGLNTIYEEGYLEECQENGICEDE